MKFYLAFNFPLLAFAGLFSGCVTIAPPADRDAANPSDADLEARAAAIHERVITLDTHLDVPILMKRTTFDIRHRHDAHDHQSQVDLPRMIEGGLDGGFFSVYLGQGPRTLEGRMQAKDAAREIFDMIDRMVAESPDDFEIALTADDAARIAASGKRIVYMGIENGWVIGRDLDVLHEFYDRGARYMTLSHTRNNAICDSSTDPAGPEHGGISEFGKLVIKEMNRLGMMVDISHISDDAAMQAIKLSEAPVIASHSSAYAIYAHPRNLNDRLLRAVAKNGGVVQMNMFSAYLKDVETSPERREALRAWREKYGDILELSAEKQAEAVAARGKIEREFPPDLATLEDVLDHIDHVVKVAGIDHIGIGADFDGGGGVLGCYDVSEIGNITLGLLKRGYSEEDIEKIWSGNVLRVLRANEEVARRLQAEDVAAANGEKRA